MSFFHSLIRGVLEAYIGLFGDAHPLASLIPLSALIGVAMLWVFGKTSNQKAIERAKKKMQAYLLELRLYGDDPGLLFRAQGNLIVANLKYMAHMFKPALILTIPMIVLLFHLDAIYGIRALRPGEAAVVTVETADAAAEAPPTVTAPQGVAVETPAVRAPELGQINWRVRAAAPEHGELGFDWPDKQWTKSIDAGEGLRYVSHRRVSSTWDQFASPGEPLLDVAGVQAVDVAYPAAEIDAFGFQLHWLVWFLLVSIVTAYALKGVFGVAV
ncbi:MAG: hypothetical protein R2748_20485 [Bryobacterales bacterium]